MLLRYDDIDLYYDILGNFGETIVFLHGWGGSTDSFRAVAQSFRDYRCVLIDFPPFGKSEAPYRVWSLGTYVEVVLKVLQKEKIQNAHFVAHSFGGRVAILLAKCYPCVVKTLTLTGSAGLKRRFSFPIWSKKIIYKIKKRLKFKNLDKYGSTDYKALSPLMKKTFIKITCQNLEKESRLIKCKTLIVYGKNDHETPVYMAKRLARNIKNSTLIIYPNCGHFAYLENYQKFTSTLYSFLKGAK